MAREIHRQALLPGALGVVPQGHPALRKEPVNWQLALSPAGEGDGLSSGSWHRRQGRVPSLGECLSSFSRPHLGALSLGIALLLALWASLEECRQGWGALGCHAKAPGAWWPVSPCSTLGQQGSKGKLAGMGAGLGESLCARLPVPLAFKSPPLPLKGKSVQLRARLASLLCHPCCSSLPAPGFSIAAGPVGAGRPFQSPTLGC